MKNREPVRCDRCLQEVYPGELVHLIEGFVICPECFLDFAFDYFSDCLTEVSELPGRLYGESKDAEGRDHI